MDTGVGSICVIFLLPRTYSWSILSGKSLVYLHNGLGLSFPLSWLKVEMGEFFHCCGSSYGWTLTLYFSPTLVHGNGDRSFPMKSFDVQMFSTPKRAHLLQKNSFKLLQAFGLLVLVDNMWQVKLRHWACLIYICLWLLRLISNLPSYVLLEDPKINESTQQFFLYFLDGFCNSLASQAKLIAYTDLFETPLHR